MHPRLNSLAASWFVVTNRPSGFRLLSMVAAFGLAAPAGFAQGTLDPVVLRTGAGAPLVSQSVPLNLPPAAEDFIRFEFGFATNERFGPGQTFDSFTVSVKFQSDVRALVVVTVDAGGNVIAPPSPGNIPANANSIQREAVAFPSLEPVFTLQTAQIVSLPLPKELLGKPLEVVFDLFDNQDAVMSLGYFRNVTLIVPEPATGSLLLLAGVLMALLQCSKRKR